MARSSRTRTHDSHEAITNASAGLFQERGFKAVSISDLMSAAGFTHGGFYAHFASKDELMAESLKSAFDQSTKWLEKRMAATNRREARMGVVVDRYLTTRARDHVGGGCPVATLASDVAREPASSLTRLAYVRGLEELVNVLGSVGESGQHDAARKDSLADLATLVGGFILSRACAGSPLSAELLAAARARLGGTAALTAEPPIDLAV